MDNQTLLPDTSSRVYINHPAYVKRLAQHVFRNDKNGLLKVAKAFPRTTAKPEIVVEEPRDYIMHHMPQ